MRETDLTAAACIDHPIWVALSLYVIGPAHAGLPFDKRLARENGWTDAHAARVIEEYKRFCFLAVTSGHVVTPSDAVDQAWHLHLSYSRDYWQRFCPRVLGRELHHEPTTGGAGQKQLHFEQYARTLQSYERIFGRSPPADLWPEAARSLIADSKARRVHPRDGLVIGRPTAALLLIIFCAALLALLLR